MGRWSFRVPVANLAAAAIGMLCLLGAVPTGGLWVTTLPSGADVWLDGTYLGRSPLFVDGLAAGEHKLSLTRSGWTPQDVSATVLAGEIAPAALVLGRAGHAPAAPGTLAIHSLRPLVLTIDGEPAPAGKDGLISLASGTHELAIAGPQGKVSRTVTILPATRTDVVVGPDAEPRSVVMAPADEFLPAGSFRVDGAQVLVRFASHEVSGRLGAFQYRVDRRDMSYDAAPSLINGRLYLPLELLTLLTAPEARK